MSLESLAKKYGVTAGKLLQFKREDTQDKHESLTTKAKPGDIIEIHEGPNPHQSGKKEVVTITIVNPDRSGKGFNYFYGKGKPKGESRIYHSNQFVWGVEDWKKIGSIKVTPHSYKGFKWTITGIDVIDNQMANLDDRLALFTKLAPKELKALYDKQEDINYHTENASMVNAFASWVVAGNAPKDFALPGKQKAKG